MCRQDKDVICVTEREAALARSKGAWRQIKGTLVPPRRLKRSISRSRSASAILRQIASAKFQLCIGRDNLDWLSIIHFKACPQDFVAADYFIQARFQRFDVERAAKPRRTADIVNGISRLQLL